MRMTIQVDVNTTDDGMEDDDNIVLLYTENGFYIEQGKDNGKRPTIFVKNKKQAKALVRAIKALSEAVEWKA